MPTNIFGKNDNYNLQSSHFIPALIEDTCNKKKKILLRYGALVSPKER